MSDYFYVPVTPTFFSKQAIDSLDSIIKLWAKMLDFFTTSSTGFRFNINTQFAGMIINQGKAIRDKNGKNKCETMLDSEQQSLFETEFVTKQVGNWSFTINDQMKKIVENLRKQNYSITGDEFKKVFGEDKEPFIVSFVQNYTDQVRSVADKLGRPVVKITETDDTAINTPFYKQVIKDFKADVQFIADKFIYLLDDFKKSSSF